MDTMTRVITREHCIQRDVHLVHTTSTDVVHNITSGSLFLVSIRHITGGDCSAHLLALKTTYGTNRESSVVIGCRRNAAQWRVLTARRIDNRANADDVRTEPSGWFPWQRVITSPARWLAVQWRGVKIWNVTRRPVKWRVSVENRKLISHCSRWRGSHLWVNDQG